MYSVKVMRFVEFNKITKNCRIISTQQVSVRHQTNFRSSWYVVHSTVQDGPCWALRPDLHQRHCEAHSTQSRSGQIIQSATGSQAGASESIGQEGRMEYAQSRSDHLQSLLGTEWRHNVDGITRFRPSLKRPCHQMAG